MPIFGLRANYAFLFPNPLWLFTFIYWIELNKVENKKKLEILQEENEISL